MRFYVKLALLVVAFVGASSSVTRDAASECAYAIRVKYVLAFGSHADFERLVDDTQRALAERCGRLDMYAFGKRWRALLDQRLAEAARQNIRLTEEQLGALREKCIREAFECAGDTNQTTQPSRKGSGC